MYKKITLISYLLILPCLLAKESPLSDPILADIDGVPGLMDKTKIENTLWLIKEIKQIHNGMYKVNAKGEPDCSRGTTPTEFLFRGKKHTLKQFVELEAQSASLPATEKSELTSLFRTMKEYFDRVNQLLAPEAAGSHQFMFRLTEEFCRKHQRPDSLLLDWNKGDEIELFRKSVTNFKIFYIFSTDLMNFLADLIVSCPKAFNAYKKSHTTETTA